MADENLSGQSPAPSASTPPPAPTPAQAPSTPPGGGVPPPAGPTAAPAVGSGGGAATFDSILESNPQVRERWQQQQAEFSRVSEQLQRLSPLAQIGWEEYQRRQQKQQQPAQPEAPKHPWGIPQFDRSMLKYLTTNERGEIVPSPYAPPGILSQYQAWEEARRSAVDKFVDDPVGSLWPALEARIQEIVQKGAGTQIQQVQAQSFASNYATQNSNWLYAGSDPYTGQPKLSVHGQMFVDKCNQLRQWGVTDPKAIATAAEEYVFGQVALQKLQSGQQSQATADAGKRNLLDAAAAASSAGPATQPAVVPSDGTARRDIRSRMRAEAAANGINMNG